MKLKRIHISHGRYYKGVDDYVNGKRKQRWMPLTRVEEGETALYHSLAALDQRLQLGNLPDRINEFNEGYLPTLGVDSRKEYKRVLNDCKDLMERLSTEDVTSADIHDVLKQVDTPRMKHHYKSRLSTFFRWCCEKRYAATNPCREISISLPKAKRVEWDSNVWHSIRNKLHPMMQCYMDLCYLLYQRNTDVRMLRLTQIGEEGIRNTPQKTAKSSGKNVTIPMTPDIRLVLERAAELRKEFKVATIYVISKPDGQPYTATGIRSTWNRAQEEVGVSGYTTKSIRPFAASAAKRAGYSLEDIQVGLAHTSKGTTEGYMERHAEAVSQITLQLPKKIAMLGGR